MRKDRKLATLTCSAFVLILVAIALAYLNLASWLSLPSFILGFILFLVAKFNDRQRG